MRSRKLSPDTRFIFRSLDVTLPDGANVDSRVDGLQAMGEKPTRRGELFNGAAEKDGDSMTDVEAERRWLEGRGEMERLRDLVEVYPLVASVSRNGDVGIPGSLYPGDLLR